jgi:hypothetical protein
VKVRWQMFPGQVLEAALTSVPSQAGRGGQDTVLEIACGVPMVVYPGSAQGVELVAATPAEREALARAGFNLPGATESA